MGEKDNAERQRLIEADEKGIPWRRWGPYLSERQWGTVREDYGDGRDSWSAFTHDQARARAYRWGEDGLAGVCDDKQLLCLAIALWNERDPILKERLFGLTNGEGNHGEDVKEYYFYLDATPTSSYLKMLYKYPQGKYPYEDLVAVNGARGMSEPEYELLDTGIFDEGRYFDVEVEYAKGGPEDLLLQITVHNRGPRDATLHVLPTLWFRHTWSWAGGSERPQLRAGADAEGRSVIRADRSELGTRWLHADAPVPVLVTENETNNERVFGSVSETPYVKDGIGRAVVNGETSAVNPDGTGTKAAVHHVLNVPAGGSATVRARLDDHDPGGDPFADFDQVLATRRAEADEFYDGLLFGISDEERLVCRQALGGMLWSKQYYAFDIERWLREHGSDPLAGGSGWRNEGWRHMVADDVISMPDKWEYPWFAAWDLAFHTVPLAIVDTAFAKQQLDLLLSRRYLHSNGQLPAYEWNFGDVNPPVHAWAAWFVYELEKAMTGRADRDFLERTFRKLSRNFSWWLNRKDADDRSIFQGGFLGLDNIGVFDRSAPLPGGGRIDQADGTAWMALYCQTMAQMALELATENRAYLEDARSLLENFCWIAAATNHMGNGGAGLWDEEDGFFYDVLRRPDGSAARLKVRSIVGLLPLAAVTVFSARLRGEYPELITDMTEFLERHPAMRAAMPMRGEQLQGSGPVLASLFDESRLRKILARMLDEEEFLGPHGIRALSRWHAEHPYLLGLDGQQHRVSYLPAESDTGMFGGNSNWRGPVWFPINIMLLRALLQLYSYFGDDFTIECPTGSGRLCTLYEVAEEISGRLTATFMRDSTGKRPVHGGQPLLQNDPHWRDLLLFYEYFHGDNGAGIGASHQTGWTGLVAVLPLLSRGLSAEILRNEAGGSARLERAVPAPRGSRPRPGVPGHLDRPVSGWPARPVIYEINTAIWLADLSRAAGRRVTLADVPASAWDKVTMPGVDAVWLMGVWQRSPAGLELATANEGLQAAFRAALPGLRPGDVAGSPYCVRGYTVDDTFGGPEALAAARAALAERGIRLLLDYVPNHVAPDHPWVTSRPEMFVNGTESDLAAEPSGWLRADGRILAHGRDPYFPAWPDVVQLDAFSPALREATIATLADIAGQCDGIRCDMAMLMTNQVFAKTWGERVGREPDEEFWPTVIAGLHARHPETVLIAEAYWDMEWPLQQQGFDFCYDKRLYDRIMDGDVAGIRGHLTADSSYQSRLVRFLENHDEPRVADRLSPEASRAAAVAIATLPGATLWHEGQFEGRRVHPPVFLSRRPEEDPDADLARWYRGLLAAVAGQRIRVGSWQLLDVAGWPDNDSNGNLLAWSWTADEADGGGRHLVVVNLSADTAQGRVQLGWPDLPGRDWLLSDLLSDVAFQRGGDELTGPGLFVDLPPWQFHLLTVAATERNRAAASDQETLTQAG